MTVSIKFFLWDLDLWGRWLSGKQANVVTIPVRSEIASGNRQGSSGRPMGDVDVSIFSISGGDRMQGRGCPPAVVITHDADSFSVNPSTDEGLAYKGGLGASTLSLAGNGLFGPSRSGSPRHSKIHPTEGPKSGTSMAVFTTEGQMMGNEAQQEQPDPNQKPHCCSGRARKTALGLFLTVLMCGTWVGITHLLKWAYVIHLMPPCLNCTTNNDSFAQSVVTDDTTANKSMSQDGTLAPFKAPFITTWIFTACNCMFFPVYLCTRFCCRRTRTTARREAMRRFREKGLSALHFLTRSVFFCVLWVGANYMLIASVEKLDATAVMALQASSASFVYLLSWVILHEQFVGIRIVAVIMCNTGIALLAYMDGVSRTSTLGGVVLAAAAAAGLAVHKVLFKKLIRHVTMGQLSIFLTLVGVLNVLLLWPIGLTLYLIGGEEVVWNQLPYAQLGGSAVLFIVANVLGNFDIAHNHDTFIKLGVVSAVPVSAVLDVHFYHVVFKGMKLAGVLLISIGFMLVLLPDNWPDYITRLIRWRCRKCPKSNKTVDPAQLSGKKVPKVRYRLEENPV
ncbi:hypothetical protein JTE90_017946 [Oedothorax gibbosus]|uniref:Thiamine transporter SLC35F3 n=1 Tax=Oedothorax gibbosus TaxID=931172 RepID=A0AAV6V812_9ARAC|nr:hypothetical protein JTE90_017946 [Oedothorax gibbosus]